MTKYQEMEGMEHLPNIQKSHMGWMPTWGVALCLAKLLSQTPNRQKAAKPGQTAMRREKQIRSQRGAKLEQAAMRREKLIILLSFV
jgi:hypothetical protein